MRVGKDMQFFGARANLAKALLYAINGGRDEMTGEQVAPAAAPVTADVLDYDEVMAAYDRTLDWLAKTYVDALNVIHYMHDKYAYERLEMALHDYPVHRFLATGIAGLSVAADSLSAIKSAQVKAMRDETGLIVDYGIDGEFPTFGNNDDRADAIAVDLVERFMGQDPPAAGLPRRRAEPVGADHHLERRLRRPHRQHPRRPASRRAVQRCGRSPSRRVASTAAWVRRSRPSLARRLET